MRNVRGSTWTVFGGAGVLALALLPGLALRPGMALADEGDPTDVGLEEAVARATRPATEQAPAGPVRIHLRVGEARLVRDLARVDVTLEVTNTSANVVEWDRTFPMDPGAEVIACALQRAGQVALSARSLTFEDGRRIYDETVRPRTTTPNPGKDPLRVEREADGRLRVVVFPVAPGEKVRVLLSFVSSLAERGRLRHYRDPLWLGDVRREGRLAEVTPEAVTTASLTVEPGILAAARAEGHVALSSLSAERLLVQPLDAAAAAMQAHVRFEAPAGPLPALTVPGAGLGTRVAFWHFDPASFLAERGITRVPAGAVLRLTGRGGGTQRLVPAEIPAHGPAVTLCARHYAASGDLAYDVELVGGRDLQRFEASQPVARADADADLADAVAGWYRAKLARHVLAWSEEAPAERRARALAYAVDLGVILPGTCALALPRAEQRTLSPQSRRTYRRDGTEIGAADGEADWIAPPSGSIR